MISGLRIEITLCCYFVRQNRYLMKNKAKSMHPVNGLLQFRGPTVGPVVISKTFNKGVSRCDHSYIVGVA